MIKAIDTDALTGIDKAESYLKSTLDLLDEGEKLPSMRDIKNSCGVGQSAIERVIARMVADGQVVAKPRSGYYKGLDQGRRTEILIFEALPDAHSTIYYRNFFTNEIVGF